ncbi:F0F1 ATP synthase subunit delta [Bifidobacterium tibiigranuli]|jgi:F-type H+-transporting ATPase subunit delta|uniref:F0F1 ATP synthase subunit delta n=1 Tax=Bifidobacterium tibiigranuli TaxID=2172043 RepID=UPI0026F31A5E|nr:F0F1 ATP synthase subunit delta [Bifidobacterium tibiigranuli]MCI2185963.1 F0F1 ATP synthase subunit delta [Bifidobacterium tibiigranuli]MCI2204832.1 F0F1 ATP synthase subunit delta [Bifidobacterium tibiigranuli]
MRGEASRLADRESRDSFAAQFSGIGEDTWRIGNELFSITALLDGNAALEHALTEASRSNEDKMALLRGIFGDQAHEFTMTILADLVKRPWSRSADIANAVEDFGVDAMMYYADHTDSTAQVSIELAELHSALIDLPVVRARLQDERANSDARVKLLHDILDGSGFNIVTLRLAEHATANLRKRRYLSTIQWLIGKFSRHMGQSLVTVTTATHLSDEQIAKLVDVYSAKLGRPVHVNAVVDASVIGGMRIQVGEEVTDNTVLAQLRHLQDTVKVGV